MALGNILREARESRGLSRTEVAEHTNMMVQIVEELENEDFHRIAAPIYGRGFLKLYAELLHIEVQPLIDEFMDIYTGKTVPCVHRMESAPADVRKPIPVAAPAEEQEKSVAPQRVEIVPRQAVRNIETTHEPLPPQNIRTPAPVKHELLQTIAPEPVITAAPAEEPEAAAAPVSAEPERQTDFFDASGESAGASAEIPPEPGDNLFGADEPNLFNTSPLQERIAEARRVMDEKEDAKKEEKKKTSLHLGSNQRLPVFQIGGRMDKTYQTKPRKNKTSSFAKFSGSLLNSLSGFFSNLSIKFPVGMRTGNRTIFVFGSLGVIVLVFLLSGVMLIFKLTKPSADGENGNKSTAAAVAKIVEKPVQPAAKIKSRIPPPPDMYFD